MNKKLNTIATSVIIALALWLSSCKEVGPQIDLTNGKHNTLVDTTYVESPVQTPEAKNVLIEMLTGVSCINCPDAHAILDNLIATNGGRVIGVAMHTIAEPAAQDDPLPDSKQPLGCADAQTIVTAFGDPGSRPFGSVDRTVNNNVFGVNSVYDDRSNWGGYTSTELALSTPVNLVLTRTYTDATKALAVSVELHYTSALTDSNRISIFLTEDSIVTSQLLHDNSDDSTYVHNGVMRMAVTAALGDNIKANLTAGTVVKKIYTATLSNTLWKPEHMHIVAFVHRYQNGNSNILQAKTISVK